MTDDTISGFRQTDRSVKHDTRLGVRYLGCGLGLTLAGLLAASGCGSDSSSGSEDDHPDGGTNGASNGAGGMSGMGGSATGGSSGSPDASMNGGSGGGSGGSSSGAVCGNQIREGDEECDDGNESDDDTCTSDCTLACGDGVVNSAEACDTAIAAGEPGACPTTCDNANPCVSATLMGTGCNAVCEETTITTPLDGDGCCPDGSTTADDSDCSVECGNGVVESGETCDTAIATGSGACQTADTCDDSRACTVDAVDNAGSCTAQCDFSQTVAPDPDAADGCCPPGADATTDADCSPLCGNGELDDDETCDTAIDQGNDGACPESCPSTDDDPCTVDELVTDDPCNPSCTVRTIDQPRNNDSCCPDGANALNDNDCDPDCGNGVREGDEECDEESARCDSDTCQWVPTAFRVTSLEVADPHLFVVTDADSGACTDVTGVVNDNLFAPLLNEDNEGLADGGTDGLLDLSFVLLFTPLDQSTSPHDAILMNAECPAPIPATSCSPVASPEMNEFQYSNITSGTDPCLGALPGTTTAGYDDPGLHEPTPGSDGCWLSNETTLTLTLAGIPFVLEHARGSAQWDGDPATNLVSGLLRGFISETAATSIALPAGLGTLDAVLPGPATQNCAVDDRDNLGADSGLDAGPGGETGWWFYLNFEADRVTWSTN